jgi:hypothetical protein
MADRGCLLIETLETLIDRKLKPKKPRPKKRDKQGIPKFTDFRFTGFIPRFTGCYD